MEHHILIVKNMVCHRCIHSVENILNNAAIPFHKVIFGEVHLTNELSLQHKEDLSEMLKNEGFELLDNHMSALIEKIKALVIMRARNEVANKDGKLNLSAFLSENLHYEYTHLSSTFSAVEGRTIEDFFIKQRIKKVKELIVYGQMTLSEIAFELDYSSIAHLSTQFKKITGLTPSYFKEVENAKRKDLD